MLQPVTAARRTLRSLGPQAVRYATAGAIVGLVYVGLTLLGSGPVGLPIQVAIPIAYVLAVTLHFVLQRTFVFRHREEFALSVHAQGLRYVVIGVTQYALTAGATAALPGLLNAPEKLVYVCTVCVISAATFLFLRTRVFHVSGAPAASAPAARPGS